MRASVASELRKFWHLYIRWHCYLFEYFVGTADFLSVQMTCLSAYMYRQISEYTDTEHWANVSCIRLSGASELRKLWHAYIHNLLFLLIFCRSQSDTLSVLMVCLSAQMYRHIFKCTDKNPKKHPYRGRGDSCLPRSGRYAPYAKVLESPQMFVASLERHCSGAPLLRWQNGTPLDAHVRLVITTCALFICF